MKTCLCKNGSKEDTAIVCRDCWKALPSALRDAWYTAATKPDRLIAARAIMVWVIKNRRTP